MYYFGLLLLALGSLGLTIFSFFSVFGLPIFILGVILVMLSKEKTRKQRIISISIFGIGILSFWPIWRSMKTVEPEVFLIPKHFQGKVNVIFSKGCGEQLEKTEEGLVYHIPKDGILMIDGELKTGFINHSYFYVDSLGKRTEIEKMFVSDFNEDSKGEKENNTPTQDQLGIFHWGRTGAFGQSGFNETSEEQNENLSFHFMEFYVSSYTDLESTFNASYDIWFDSLKTEKLNICR